MHTVKPLPVPSFYTVLAYAFIGAAIYALLGYAFLSHFNRPLAAPTGERVPMHHHNPAALHGASKAKI